MTRVKKLEVVCKLRINPSFKILTTETWTASKVSDNMLVKQILKHVGYLTHCDLTKEVFILFLDLTKWKSIWLSSKAQRIDKTAMSILQINLKHVKVNIDLKDTACSHPIKILPYLYLFFLKLSRMKNSILLIAFTVVKNGGITIKIQVFQSLIMPSLTHSLLWFYLTSAIIRIKSGVSNFWFNTLYQITDAHSWDVCFL